VIPRLALRIALLLVVLVLLPAPLPASGLPTGARHDAAGRVQVDVHYDCRLAAPLTALAAAGLDPGTRVNAPPYCVIEGWADPASVSRLAAVPGVSRISLPDYVLPRPPIGLRRPALKASGSSSGRASGTTTGINANGVRITRADQFVSQTGATGAGVTVGVQSNGAASWRTIAARGELPASVSIVYPAGATSQFAGDDEGTMLMEQIHAIAPGAALAYCDPSTFADYLSCLQQLINAGATVLVDDLNFVVDDIMNAGNDQSTAVANLLASNPKVALYTSAGNANGSYWEGTYAYQPPAQGTPALSCTVNGVTTPDSYVASFGSTQAATLTVTGSTTFPLLLAWNDVTGQPATHFDLYVYNGGTQVACFDAGDTTSNANGHQLLTRITLPAGTYALYVASTTAQAGTYIKLWAGGDGLTAITPSSPGSTVSPQAFATGAMSIGAVDGADGIGNTIEPYSSLGPVFLPLPSQTRLWAPALVAPDDINVDAAGTGFASLLFPDSSGTFPQGLFKGTSASAPNAGGVAALIQAAWPQLTRDQLNQVLQTGAVWPGTAGTSPPDATFGYGRVDAVDAATAAQALTGSAPTPAPGDSSSSGTGSSGSSGSSSGAGSAGKSGGGGAWDAGSLGILTLAWALLRTRALRRRPASQV